MSPGVIDARGYLRGVIVAGVNVARVIVAIPIWIRCFIEIYNMHGKHQREYHIIVGY